MAAAWLALLCASVSLGAGGCSRAPAPEATTQERLETALLALPGGVDPTDASRLSRAAVAETGRLRARYRPLAPPQLGNLAFHLGLRERALCCHWTEDLMAALAELPLRTLTLRWGVASHGSRFREHSAVVAVPVGSVFGDGLVLDAWRRSGVLQWARVDRDAWVWQPHPSEGARRRVVCATGGR